MEEVRRHDKQLGFSELMQQATRRANACFKLPNIDDSVADFKPNKVGACEQATPHSAHMMTRSVP